MSEKIIAVGMLSGLLNPSSPNLHPKVNKYDAAGNTYQHGHRTELPRNFEGVTGVAIDPAGNVYLCGMLTSYAAGSYTTYKTDPNGNVVWAVNHGAAVLGICIDSSGNVYTVGDAVNASGQVYPHTTFDGGGASGDRTGYYSLRKYNSAGSLQWSADHGFAASWSETQAAPIPIIYSSGHLYIGGWATEGETIAWGALTKVNATTGAVVWRAASSPYEMLTRSITFDGSGNIYIAGAYINPPTYDSLRAYDADGNLLYSAELIGTDGQKAYGVGVAIRSDGDVIALTYIYKYNSTDYTYLHRFSSSLVYETSYAAAYQTISPRDLVIDDDDALYIASANTIYDTVWKYPADVSAVEWSVATAGYTVDTIAATALAISSVELPPLQVRLGLGVPTWTGDYYTLAPGLPLALALGVPYPLREYAGPALPTVFRLYLTGGTGTIELPLSSFSYREGETNAQIDAIVPLPSIALIEAIEDRQDGTLLLYRGIRFRDGTEQLDLMASVVFTSLRYDVGANSASLSLAGQSARAASRGLIRPLSGISYRATIDGSRRVRAALDTYLHVGDIADLGDGDTLTVASLVMSVDANAAQLEIAE